VAIQQQRGRAFMLLAGCFAVKRLMEMRKNSDRMKEQKNQKKTQGNDPFLFSNWPCVLQTDCNNPPLLIGRKENFSVFRVPSHAFPSRDGQLFRAMGSEAAGQP
jgi:hypothetical protein